VFILFTGHKRSSQIFVDYMKGKLDE